MRLIVTTLAAAAVLAGCSQPAENPAGESTEVPLPAGMAPAATPAAAPDALSGFSHPAGVDLFGYYMPATDIQVGNLKLSHLHLGGAQEFTDWEAGKREGTYAPVMLQFEDVTSPMVSNELGGESRSVTERALADAYSITTTDVVFVDNHPRLGKISFTGRFDPAALAAAKAETATAGKPVLTGTLTVGGQTFSNVQFSWFGGD